MIEVEHDEIEESKCDCCGNKSLLFTRYLYENEDPTMVYLCTFVKGHIPKIISGIISIGDWSHDGKPSDRFAFPFMIKLENENYHVMMDHKKYSPWKDTTILGKILDRNESLSHELKPEVYEVLDYIVTEDEEVINLLG